MHQGRAGDGADASSANAVRIENRTRGTLVAGRAEAATTFWSRFMGLMGRRPLPSGDGLWIPDTVSIHMFFMRFPIDCVFLGPADGDGTRPVVQVRHALPPWRGIVWWARGSKGVVELPAGTLATTRTAVGDRITLAPA